MCRHLHLMYRQGLQLTIEENVQALLWFRLLTNCCPVAGQSPTQPVLLTVDPLDLSSSHRDSSGSPRSTGTLSPCGDSSLLRPTAEHHPTRVAQLLSAGFIRPPYHGEEHDIKFSDPSAFLPFPAPEKSYNFNLLLSALCADRCAGGGQRTDLLQFKGVKPDLFVKVSRALS